MDFAGTSSVLLLLKAAGTVALVVCAVVLLRSSHIDRTPKLAAVREARRKPYVSPHSMPLPQQAVAPKINRGDQLTKLARVLDVATNHVQAVHAATRTAAREIDGAEMALNRLLQEITGVMPTVITPTIVPRRELSVAIAERNAAKAVAA